MFGFIQNEAVEVPGSCMTLFEIATDKQFPMGIRKKVLEIVGMFGKRAGVDDLAEMLSVPFKRHRFTVLIYRSTAFAGGDEQQCRQGRV